MKYYMILFFLSILFFSGCYMTMKKNNIKYLIINDPTKIILLHGIFYGDHIKDYTFPDANIFYESNNIRVCMPDGFSESRTLNLWIGKKEVLKSFNSNDMEIVIDWEIIYKGNILGTPLSKNKYILKDLTSNFGSDAWGYHQISYDLNENISNFNIGDKLSCNVTILFISKNGNDILQKTIDFVVIKPDYVKGSINLP